MDENGYNLVPQKGWEINRGRIWIIPPQAVSRRSLTTKTWIRLLASPCDVCGGQSGNGTGFFSEYLGFPVSAFNQFAFTLKLLLAEGQARKTGGTLGYVALRTKSLYFHIMRFTINQ
jgi:hypothetical protein